MARGWESKSIESQMELAESRREEMAAAQRSATENATKARERESLELSRARVLQDIASATHPRYRETLEAGLRHLDEKLAQLTLNENNLS